MLTFRSWSPANAPNMVRLYVNGLPTSGKAYLTLKRNRVTLVADEIDDDEVENLSVLLFNDLVSRGIVGAHTRDAQTWKQLLELASSPRSKPPPPSVGHAFESATGGQFPVRTPEAPSTHGLDIRTITNISKPIHIKVDHREPEAIIDLLRTAPMTTVEVCSLELGDYLINDKIIVERKSVSDFEASVIDDEKRLFNQSERLKHQTDWIAVLLLEGDVFGRRQRMSAAQISGALTYLGVIQGMNVITTLDQIHTSYFLIKLGAHDGSGLGYELALRTKKPKALLSARSYVLEGVPGVSAGLARLLLQHFGSIARIAAASEAELCAVPGIGAKRAAQIVAVLQGSAD